MQVKGRMGMYTGQGGSEEKDEYARQQGFDSWAEMQAAREQEPPPPKPSPADIGFDIGGGVQGPVQRGGGYDFSVGGAPGVGGGPAVHRGGGNPVPGGGFGMSSGFSPGAALGRVSSGGGGGDGGVGGLWDDIKGAPGRVAGAVGDFIGWDDMTGSERGQLLTTGGAALAGLYSARQQGKQADAERRERERLRKEEEERARNRAKERADAMAPFLGEAINRMNRGRPRRVGD